MSSLTSQVLRSSFLLLIMRFIQRSIGLISTLVLARLLTPDDFGIVAIAMLILYFCDTLSTLGSQQYIIQKSEVNDDDINTSWTLDLIMKALIWSVLVISIPTITAFYDKPELENVLYVTSLVLLIGSLKSPGFILLRRQLQYKPIFRLSIIQKFISFFVVMIIAYFYQTYWALIIAEVSSVIVAVTGTYIIFPKKPEFCLKNIREQWSFSQWVLLKGGVGFTRAEVDTILVSKYFSSEELGGYHLSRHLSIIPSRDIIAPAIEPLLASYSRVKDDAPQLAYQFSLSMLVVSILIMPIAVFMFFFPEKIIDFFLGSQWTDTYTLLSALSILFFIFGISQVLEQLCIALGKVKELFIYDLLSLVFIFSLLLIFIGPNLYDFTLLRGLLGLISTAALFIYISHFSAISIFHILKLSSPALLAALISAYLTLQINFMVFSFSLFNLLLVLSVFCLFYIFTIIIFYIVFYRYFSEGRHLYRLVLSLVDKLKKKVITKDLT